jgi:hypothetical protein
MIYKIIQKTKDRATWTPIKTGVLRKGKQFLLHILHLLRYSCYKPCDKFWMRKGSDCDYDKRNIFMVICDTEIL